MRLWEINANVVIKVWWRSMGGSPVQWNSRQQPFLVLGESILSIMEILENNQLCEKGK